MKNLIENTHISTSLNQSELKDFASAELLDILEYIPSDCELYDSIDIELNRRESLLNCNSIDESYERILTAYFY